MAMQQVSGWKVTNHEATGLALSHSGFCCTMGSSPGSAVNLALAAPGWGNNGRKAARV